MTFAVPIVLAAALVACGDENPHQPVAPSRPTGIAGVPVSRSQNGCILETATDHTGMAEVEIRFGGEVGFLYEPSCVRVGKGTRLKIIGDFLTHPFVVGRLGSEIAEADRTSPLRATESGGAATFVMDRPGIYPYFCNLHGWDGMMGAVYVE